MTPLSATRVDRTILQGRFRSTTILRTDTINTIRNDDFTGSAIEKMQWLESERQYTYGTGATGSSCLYVLRTAARSHDWYTVEGDTYFVLFFNHRTFNPNPKLALTQWLVPCVP